MLNAPVPAPVPSAHSALRGRVVARRALSAEHEEAMFALLRAHFAGVDRATFEADLAEKTCVILIDDEDGILRGFSTMRVYETTAPGRCVTVVYSGDTIVARGFWGSPELPRAWIRGVRQAVPHDGREVYWLLLTSGFRTYRFLSVFFRMFHPRHDQVTPPGVQQLIDAVATERFGARYDAAAGIVRFARPSPLQDDLAAVPTGRTLDAHVRFFLARNPGFADGDELACVTRIREDNLTPAALRMARRAHR